MSLIQKYLLKVIILHEEIVKEDFAEVYSLGGVQHVLVLVAGPLDGFYHEFEDAVAKFGAFGVKELAESAKSLGGVFNEVDPLKIRRNFSIFGLLPQNPLQFWIMTLTQQLKKPVSPINQRKLVLYILQLCIHHINLYPHPIRSHQSVLTPRISSLINNLFDFVVIIVDHSLLYDVERGVYIVHDVGEDAVVAVLLENFVEFVLTAFISSIKESIAQD